MSDLGRIAIVVAALAEGLYVLGLLTVRWWTSPVGRSRFVKALSFLAAVGTLAAARYVDVPGWLWNALAVFLAVGTTYQLAVFTRERLTPDD